MFTMPDAKKTDVQQILKKLGATEAKVKEAAAVSVFQDKAKEVALADTSYVPTETAQRNLVNILSRLNRDPGTRVMLVGEKGSGKHTFLGTVARAMLNKEFKGLKKTKLIEVTGDLLARVRNKRIPEETIASQTKDAILYCDLDRLSEAERGELVDLPWEAPVLAIGPDDADGSINHDRWESVNLSPYDMKELAEILKMHGIIAQDKHFIKLTDQEKLNALLLRYGPTFFPRALPGAAIELLKYAVADVVLHGERELSPRRIAEIVARQSANLSADALLQNESQRILKVEEILNQRLIGQTEAKRAIAKALRIRASGLANERKPIASFVFLGPTGVGKTEMAKALALALFDDESNMVRFDMSEYQEPHTVARLIGSPPGYVGYEQGGQLTDAIQKRPFSVVLLDEIDKAHPEVLNPLLQVLDDGRLTDGKGRTVDFSQAIVIMTSNHGSSFVTEAIEHRMDPAQMKKSLIAWFRKQLRPELVNRIDSIVAFDPITMDDASKILELQIHRQVSLPLSEEHGVHLTIDPQVKTELLRLGFDAQMGARPLQRAISEYLLGPLSSLVLSKSLKKGSRVNCTLENGQIIIK
jgi:ATP-dependent Clp protease ATP-binding subunit ClpA